MRKREAGEVSTDESWVSLMNVLNSGAQNPPTEDHTDSSGTNTKAWGCRERYIGSVMPVFFVLTILYALLKLLARYLDFDR